MMTLAAFAASGGLLFILLDSQLRLTASPYLGAIWRAVPAIGGAAVLAYLETIRDRALTICANPAAKVFSVIILIAVLAATVATIPVWVTVRPGSRILVDGRYSPPTPGSSFQQLDLTGLTNHRITVSEKGPNGEVYSDEIDMGPLDVLVLWLRRQQPSSDKYRIGTSRRLSVDAGGAAHFVYVSGNDFPEFYLRGIRRDGSVTRRGDSSTVAFQLDPRTGMSPKVRVPVGRYRVRVDGLPCQGAKDDSVVVFEQQDQRIDFAGACAEIGSNNP
jgi:hypothetical protein